MSDCRKCGAGTVGRHPFCGPCEDVYLAAGLCKWCGERPRKPRVGRAVRQSEYCPACQQMLQLDAAVCLAPPRAAYRGPDHRENTRETKGL